MNPGEQYFRLGDMLLQRGILSEKKLQRGLTVAHESRRRIGDVLVELGYVTEEQVAHCLADQYGFDFCDVDGIHPTDAALSKLDAEFALKWCVLPIDDAIRFVCVIADPLNVELSDLISALARKSVAFSIAPKSALQLAIRKAYGLPMPTTATKGRKKKAPSPESVMQRDRAMLLEGLEDLLEVESSVRRAS